MCKKDVLAMGIVKKRAPAEIVQGFFSLCHPIPVLFHTLAVTIFVLVAAWPFFSWATIVLVIVAHVAMQAAIAVLNDYCDRRLDAISKRDKPIARGQVYPHEALLFGLLLIVFMICLLLPLNRLALLISLCYLALGISYNLGLKSTPWSGIVFALAIPLIPVYAFVGVGHVLPFVFWLVPVAALLGVALNLANSLPDIEEDKANRARTLAVVVGLRGSLLLCPLLILASGLLIAVLALAGMVVVQAGICLTTLIVACLAVVGMWIGWGQEPSMERRKHYFYLLVAICLLLAGGWLVSILM